MADFELHPNQLDPATVPPPLSTGETGSFARYTFAVRIPRIIEETWEHNTFPAEIVDALTALRAEILGGPIRGLQEDAADVAFWNTVSAPYIGRGWLDVPWYWAESYLYRRILEATHYFQPGPWRGFDPFASQKAEEWRPTVAPAAVESLLDGLPAALDARCAALLRASLWGNRIDLSYKQVAGSGAGGRGAAGELLTDDTDDVCRRLAESDRCDVIIINDNAGTELAMDLALADFLLTANDLRRVTLHVKPQPFFVSDAMAADVEAGIRALAGGGDHTKALAGRLREHLAAARLRVTTHWFYCTSLFYYQLPTDLLPTLAAADLVIVKGDANYRRLLGDAHWPYETLFGQITAYFPASLLALRTLKSEIVVGLAEGESARLQAQDPNWLINGTRGVIQGRL
jgi:uncharacterized protein with ATP-grasp and redox domains